MSQTLDTTKITRVEVINFVDGETESLKLFDAKAVVWDIQDEGRTLKIFVSGGSSEPDYNWFKG